MMDLSFAWTTPALVAGRKSCTRRDWDAGYARRFPGGAIVTALNRQRRHGGKPVAAIRILRAPYLESTAEAPDSDYQAEGFDYLETLGVKVDKMAPRVLWRVWHHPSMARPMWVVRFELVELTAFGLQLRDQDRIGAGAARLL